MGKYRAYPEYRDSGVEWLGEVPGHWDVKKTKYISEIILSNVDKKTVDGQPEVFLCNYTDVYYNEKISGNIDFMKATATPEQIVRFSLRAGDTLITKDSENPNDIAIPAYVPETLAGVLCGYHLAIVRPKNNVDGGYIARVFQSSYANSTFATRANGLTRYGLGYGALSNTFFPRPPKEEQTQIAAFLDRETAKIDRLIARQEQLIELLKEKRQAVISHAVTKGLDPDAPMKDSGVEWLGEIPAHWEVKQIRYVSPTITVGIVVTPAKYYEDSGVACLRSLNVKENFLLASSLVYISQESNAVLSKSQIRSGDIVIVRTGQPGTSAVVTEEFNGCNCIDLIIIRQYSKFNSNFLSTFINSPAAKIQVAAHSDGAIQQHFNIEVAKSLYAPIPPIEEQEEIMAAVESQKEKFGSLIEKAMESVSLLQERRTALISAAVTGKIDVREAA